VQKILAVGTPGRGLCSLLSSRRSDGSFTETRHRHERQQPFWCRGCLGRDHPPWQPGVHHQPLRQPESFPEGKDSGAVFVGVAHSGSPSLHVILEEFTGEDDSTSSEGRSSSFPISRGYNMVTLIIPITTTPPSEGTPVPLTIPTVLQWATVPQPDTGLILERLWTYQEEQQCVLQVDAERRAA
jgi:hypothetical protein